MNWLKTIDNMPGPEFLLLYGAVVLVTLAVCFFWSRIQDPSRNLPTPPVPSDLDPVEIAYLRGGENAVARLVIFDLLRRGYLEQIETRKFLIKRKQIQQAAGHPSPTELIPLERNVYDYFPEPVTVSDIFPSLPNIVEKHCQDYKKHYEECNFHTTSEARMAAWWPGLAGVSIIVGLGGFKLFDALGEGRSNVGFLIFMGIVSLMLLGAICKKGRLTHLGKRYLQQLKEFYGSYENSRKSIDPATGVTYIQDKNPATDPGMLMAMGVFGISVLQDTEYAYFGDLFKQAGGWGGGGCGGGCGGGGGGGGCGGGGCGGGGCGGG